MTWNYEMIASTFSEMAEDNYEDMVKALLSMELSVQNKPVLDALYQDFMSIDDFPLVSDDLRLRAESYQEQLQEELTDLLEKLYETGEGASIVIEALTSNSISETLAAYEGVNDDDYSSMTLETLQDMIQKDLDLTSQDYFGDVTRLALQKNLLDQKSQFLQHYVASFLDNEPFQKDQSDLVLD